MKVLELSGGVGGARMARGLAQAAGVELTVVVNVGDDETVHGLHVSPDVDTVLYTLAGVEGPDGWGRADDSFRFNDELARFGLDNTFRLGDLDLALCVARTSRLSAGTTLSEVTRDLARGLGVGPVVLPVSDQPVRTEIRTASGEWIGFQEYFVARRHRDEVADLRFAGAALAQPAPGVIEAVEEADLVLIAPSNPPLSIWPILAVDEVRRAIADHPEVVAVSPLIGGRALKGPADRVMASLGLPPGNAGVAEAYRGLISTLVVDTQDGGEAADMTGVEVMVTDTRIADADRAMELAEEILSR